jgi:uncharacterized protein
MLANHRVTIVLLRWLFLGMLGLFAYRLWNRYKAFNTALKKTATAQINDAPAQLMVKCAYCDLHIPQQKAVVQEAHWFCCQQHKDAFTKP